MTEFKEDFHKREFDPRLLVRACQFYLKRLDLHMRNIEHLSQEDIKYTCDRLLEGIFTLEDYSNMIFEDIPDEEKKTLEMKEVERNKDLYLPGMRCDKGIEYVRRVIESVAKRAEDNRNNAKVRISEEQS